MTGIPGRENTLNIETCISYKYIDEYSLEGKTIVVIDTLRATSVMVTAMENGTAGLYAVETPEEALEMKRKNPGILTGGERQGIKIEGFDLSNSPLDYRRETVEGREIVMSTSNGTRAIASAGKGREILIGSILNAGAVSEEIERRNKDTVIINAGTQGKLSLDDFITGGIIAAGVRGAGMCDTTLAAVLSSGNPSWKEVIKEAVHYKRMVYLEYFDDLSYCFRLNSCDSVPLMKNFKITGKSVP